MPAGVCCTFLKSLLHFVVAIVQTVVECSQGCMAQKKVSYQSIFSLTLVLGQIRYIRYTILDISFCTE